MILATLIKGMGDMDDGLVDRALLGLVGSAFYGVVFVVTWFVTKIWRGTGY